MKKTINKLNEVAEITKSQPPVEVADELQAALLGLQFTTMEKNKSIIHNPTARKAVILKNDSHFGARLNTEQKEEILLSVLNAVLANEKSVSAQVVANYAKISTHFMEAEVLTWADVKLKELAAQNKLKIINDVFPNNIIYAY